MAEWSPDVIITAVASERGAFDTQIRVPCAVTVCALCAGVGVWHSYRGIVRDDGAGGDDDDDYPERAKQSAAEEREKRIERP